MRLDGKVAIVTGGATGIGRAIALEMARAGADVVIASRNAENLRAAAADIESLGRSVRAIRTDIRSRSEVEALVAQTIAAFGQIDILVNNAAMITPYTPFRQISEEHWDEVLETNLKGCFLCTQAVIPHMVERSYGKIINITSMAALGCIAPGLAPYIASKAGMIGLTKACASEFGPSGINVNAIAVGRVETQMSHTIRTPQQIAEYLEHGRKAAVLGRLGQPEDIAHLAVFLATDKASFITGQIIHDDGGRTDRM